MNRTVLRNSLLVSVFFTLLQFTSFDALAAPPRAHHLYISGTTAGPNPATFTAMEVGFTLKVWYTYAGGSAESGTTFQWYTNVDQTGAGKTAIAGATSQTFLLTAAQQGLYISVVVTPHNAIDGFGTPVEFQGFSNVPLIKNVVLPSGNSCLKAGGGVVGPGNVLDTSTPVCSPRTTTWQITYQGIDYDAGPPRIFADFGDGGGSVLHTPTLSNALLTKNDTINLTDESNQLWIVSLTHTYDYSGGSLPSGIANQACTYTLKATWGHGGVGCAGSGIQTQPFTVWDKENNTNLGTLDINHDPTSAGVEAGEVTSICQGDQSAIRVEDGSDFDCTAGGAIKETVLVNDQARWIQWVYGSASTITTGAGPTQQIIINGVSYLSSQLPVYGRVTYQPASTTAPLPSITDNIQMPTSANVGETMIITMRSWNTCNPLDNNVADGNGFNQLQGGANNVFDITHNTAGSGNDQPGLAPQFPTIPGPQIYANSSPVLRTYTLKIITKPTVPTSAGLNLCYGTSIVGQTFTVGGTAGSTIINWYNKNPKLAGFFKMTNSVGTNSTTFKLSDYTVVNQAVGGTAAGVNTSLGGGAGGVYSVWATYIVGASNACESDPVEIVLTIKPQLTAPGVITGATNVCVTDVNSPYSLGSAAQTPSIPITTSTNAAQVNFTTQYLWTFSNGNAAVNAPNTAQSITANFSGTPSTTIQVLEQYTTAPTCNTGSSTLAITISPSSVGGTVTPSPTICNGSNTGTLTLGGSTGSIVGWERNFNGGGFVAIAATAGLTTFSEIPPNGAGTYNYHALLKSGTCAQVASTANTVTVNPIPTTPNITQAVGSTGLTICADGVQKTILQSDNSDGNAASYLWFKGGVSTGITTSTITLTTTAQSGSYTVQKIGIAPSNCPSVVSTATVVTINPLPSVSGPTGGGSICAGNPAPDIVWTFLTGTAPFSGTWTDGTTTRNFTAPLTTLTATSFTVSAPYTSTAGTYKLLSLTDANSCVGTVLGGSVAITIGGSPPLFTSGPSLNPAAVCNNGASTTDPQLVFNLDAGSASTGPFTLNYTIDGSANRTKTFNTNAASAPTAAVSFSDAELNNLAPNPHLVKIVSIISPSNCQTVFNTTLNFVVNSIPAAPTGPVNNKVCQTAGGGVPLLVTDPGATATIKWFSDVAGTLAAVGVTGGSHGDQFTPTSNATATFYAYTYSATGPTNCPSATGLAVTQTQDLLPAAANAGPDQQLCGTTTTLAGNAATNGGTGTWTVQSGTATITAINSPTSGITGLVQNPPLGAATTATLRWSVASALGACATSTDDVILTVNPLPTKIDPLPSVCEDTFGSGTHVVADMNTFNASVSNGTVTWFKDIGHTQPLGAAPAGPITISAVQKIVYFHSVLATTCATDGTVTFTINALPTANNKSFSFCEDFPIGSNQHAGIDLTANNTAITGGAPGVTVAWFSDAGLTTPIVPPTSYTLVGNKTVFAKVTNTATTCVNVATVNLTTLARPANNPIVGNASVCTGGSIILYQITPHAGSTYTWTVVGTPAADVVLFAGGGTNSGNFFVLLQFPAATGTVALTVVETNSNGCPGNTSNYAISVNSAPPANVINGLTQVCSSQTAVLYQVATPNGTSTYTWSVSAGASITSSAGASINVDFGTISPVTVGVTETSSSGCVGAPATTTVTVNTRPTMTSSSTAQVCSGATPGLPFTSDLASTYAWKVTSITGAITGTSVGNTGTGNLGTTFTGAGALKNTTGSVGSVAFDVTPTATAAPNCQGATQSVLLTINPEPVLVSAQTATVCSNTPANYSILLSPLNLPAGTLFNWPKPAMSDLSTQGSTGTNVSASLPPQIVDVLVNTSNIAITATYTISPTSGLGCPGTPNTVVITVNPQPVGAAASAAAICSNAAVGYNLQTQNINTLGNSVPSTFSWVAANNVNVGGASTTAQSGNIITDVLTNVTSIDQTVMYTVTPTSSAHSCAGASFVISVVVHPKPVGVIANTAAICSDAAVGYNLQSQNINTVGNSVAANFSWIAANNTNIGGESTTAQAGATLTDVLTNVTNADQTVVYTVTPTSSANGCVGSSFTVSVVVHPKPVGVNDIAAAICSGVGVGYNLQLQNINSLGNGVVSNFSWVAAANVNVTGQSTTPQLTGTINDVLTNVTNANQTIVYTVTPTSSANGCVGASFTVSITVHPKPVGINASAPAICSDASVGYNLQTQDVNTLGNSVASTFSWIATNNGNVGGESTTAQAGPVITDILSNVTNNDQTVVYTVTPTGSANSCVGSSFTISVLVHPKPVGANATAAPICSDATVNYNLQTQDINALGNSLNSNFSWLAAANGNVGGASLTAQSGAIITDALVNITNTDQSVVYTVTPSSMANNCTGSSFTVTVVVHPKPVGANVIAPAICSNSPMSYDLQIQNINTLGNAVVSTFTWVGTPNVNIGGESTSPQSGGTITDILTNVTNGDQTVIYTVTPTSSANLCVGASFTISVTVHPKPVGVNASAPPICSDASVGYNLQTQNVNTVGNSVASTFSWIAAANPNTGGESTTAQAGTTISDILTNVTTSNQTVVYTVTPTSSANSCAGTPFSISVIVHPKPVGVTTTAAAICSDASVNYDLMAQNIVALGNSVNSTFSWIAAANGNVSGESTTAQATSIINDVLTNVTNADQTIVYTVTPTSTANSCVGASFTISVVVHPKPVGVNVSAPAICSNASVAYNLQTQNINVVGNVVNSSFSWVATPNGNVSGESTSAQSTTSITDVLVNVTSSDQTVVYTATPTSTLNSCVGTPFTVSVLVHPKPVGANAAAPAICSDASVAYNLQTQNINTLGNSVASNFNWKAAANGNVSGESTITQAGSTLTDVLVNVTNNDQTVIYTVTPTSSANACLGSSFTVSVLVHPKPVGVAASAPAICSDAMVNYNLQTQDINTVGNSLASNFSWIAIVNGNVSGESTTPQSGNLLTDVITNVTGLDQTVVYTVTPTSSANGCLGASFAISVVVHPKPVGVSAAAPAICSDLPVGYDLQNQNINALGNGVSSTFSWIAASNGNIGGESTTAQVGAIINDHLINVSTGDQTVMYTVTPTSSASSCVGTPFTISVLVHPKPVGINATAPAICSDASVNYDIQNQNINTFGNGIVSSFSWVAAANANVSGQSTTSQAGNVINDILVNVTNSDQTIVYTVTPVSTSDNCTGAPAFTVTITIHPKPVGVTGNAPAICSDAIVNYNLQTQNINTLGNSVVSTFTWIAAANANVSGESTTIQTGNLLTDALTNVTSLDQTVVYTVTPTSSANSCLGAAFTISVVVHPKPVGAIASAPAICSDLSVGYNLQTQNINALGNAVVSTFSWVAASNAFVGGESTATQTGTTISDILTNVTNGDQVVVYTVTPTSGNTCAGTPFTVSVTVHPKPVGINAIAPPICSDASVNYDIQSQNINTLGNGINSTFSWVAAANANVSGQSTTPQSGNLINDNLTNITNADQTVVYTVIPSSTSNNCAGAPAFTVTIKVHPKPVGVTATTPSICSDASVNYDLQAQNVNVLGNSLNATFSWVATANANVTGESTVAQAGSLISDNLVNVTGLDQTVVYTVIPTSAVNNCVGDVFTISVLVHPKPVGVATAAPPICSDASVGYDLQVQNINALGNGVISNFSWVAASNGSVGGESTSPQTGTSITDILTNVTNADQVVSYTVTPTSGANSCLGASFVISVTVHPKPVGVSTTAPSICSNTAGGVNYDLQNTNINILGNGLASTFSWVAASNPNVSGESTLAQSGSIITDVLINVKNSDQIVIYSVTPTGPDGCAGTVFNISVTVKPEPVGVADTKSICSDNSVAYDLQNNVSVLGNGMNGSSFSWMAMADNPNVTGESLTAQNTASITDLLVNVTANNEIVNYTVTPTGVNGCLGDAFNIAITVQPEPVLMVTPAPVCSGLPTNLTLATSATSGPIKNYNIISEIIQGGLTAAGGNAPFPSNGQAANYLSNDKFTNKTNVNLTVTYRVVPVSTANCDGAFVDVVVTIQPEPVVSTTLNSEVCSSKPSGITLNTNGTSEVAANYDITAVVDGGLTGTPTTGAGLLPNAILNDNFVNKNAVPLNVTYTVVPHGANGCVGSSQVIVLKVDPEPVLFNPGFPAACSSNATNTNPVNVVLGTNGTSVNAGSYLLSDEEYSIDGGVTFTTTLPANFNPFGGANAVITATGDINLVKNDMFTNTSAISVVVRYTIVPTGPAPANCTGAALNYTVVVNPEPNMQPGAAAVCSGDATGLALVAAVGSPAITGYDLQSIFIADPRVTPFGTNAGLGPYPNGNFLAADKFTNTSNIPLHVIYTIVPVAGTCLGAPKTVDLTVNPAPGIASNLNATVCSSGASGIVLATDPTSVAASSYNIVTVTISPGLTQTAGNTGNGRMLKTSNEIKNDVFQNLTNGPLTVTYSVQGVSAASCTGPATNIVLTIEPAIVAAPVNNKPDICSSDKTNINLVSPSVPTSGTISFNYTASSSAGGLVSGFQPVVSNLPANAVITDSLVNNSPSQATVTYTITAVANGARNGLGCSSAPVVVTVKVEPKPKMTVAPYQPVCEGTALNIKLSTTTLPSASIQFNVLSVVAQGGMTSTPPAASYTNGQSITDVWSNPNTTADTVFYTIQPVIVGGLGCTGDQVVIPVVIKPLPNLTPVANMAICSSSDIDVLLTYDVSTTINKWTTTPLTGTVKGAGGGSGDEIFQTLTNADSTTASVRYTVTPKADLCVGPVVTFDVTVNPIPKVHAPTTKTICFGSNLSVALTSSVAGSTFAWTVDSNVSGATGGTGSTISQTLTNTAGDFLTYHIIATGPATTNCQPFDSTTMNVIAAPQIDAAFLNTEKWLCAGSRDFLQIQFDGQAPFSFTYSINGTLQAPITKASNFKSIPIQPLVTTIYKIESVKDFYGCSVIPSASDTINVSNVTTSFTFNPPNSNSPLSPVLSGGNSFVTFTNTSVSVPPNDPNVVYSWDFGEDAHPDTVTGFGPITVDYTSQGEKRITLSATNAAAASAGVTCAGQVTQIITIKVAPLIAAYVAQPLQACFPSNITVIKNTSTGDIMSWKLYDNFGSLVAVSNDSLPVFNITNPGEYTLYLATSDSKTGQSAVDPTAQVYDIYAKPFAAFDALPHTVYVPNTVLTTLNNSSSATEYSWDFGDGKDTVAVAPTHIYKVEGLYTVTLIAENDHGGGIICTDTAKITILAKQGGISKLPNAFTPNLGGSTGGKSASGSNYDVFLPNIKGAEEYDMQIYDRWGNLIFETTNITVGWDGYDRNGKLMPAGVYVFKITLLLSDGQRTTQIGDVTMIR